MGTGSADTPAVGILDRFRRVVSQSGYRNVFGGDSHRSGMVLPAGSSVPPLPHLLVLLGSVGVVLYSLSRAEVQFRTRTVLALAPWMLVGSALYVLYQIGVVPDPIAPFVGSPAVYMTTGVLAGIVWLGAWRTNAEHRLLAGVGTLAFLVPAGAAIGVGIRRGTVAPAWPLLGVLIAGFLGWLAWRLVSRLHPRTAQLSGWAGVLVLFAHALDGVSTAIGVDVLDFGEQTPLSRMVMEAAGTLPTASTIGVGWLFVLVKLVLAVVVLWLLADLLRDDRRTGNALLLLVAGVGLGPGAHNVLLFTVLGSAGL